MNSKAISVLAEAGISGVDAEMALRRMLSVLAAQGDAVSKALETLGIEPGEVDPAHERTLDIVGRLRQAGLSEDQARSLFGDGGSSAYLILARRFERFEILERSTTNAES